MILKVLTVMSDWPTVPVMLADPVQPEPGAVTPGFPVPPEHNHNPVFDGGAVTNGIFGSGGAMVQGAVAGVKDDRSMEYW